MFDAEAFGKSVGQTIREAVEKATGPLLARIDALELQLSHVPAGRDGVDGKDGRDAEPPTAEQIAAAIAPEMLKGIAESWLAANPPSNGKDGADGIDGKDGASITVADVEPLVEQRMASWALDFERRAQGVLERAVDRLPKPADGKDGLDGSNGKDGLGFDDLDLVQEDDRRLTLRFVRGDQVKTFPMTFPVLIERGVFKEGVEYQKGDGVTWAGSFWVAQTDTKSKPADGNGEWRLTVKRGRDGIDGKDGKPGEKGAPGRDGFNGRGFA